MKKIDNRIDAIQQEKEILKFWEQKQIFNKLRKKNKGKKPWSFIDGPITANNKMGVHHGWGRSYKDLFQRYFAMKGYDQRYQNGFDGQGLWVEVEVEKDLGLNSKKEIEEYGLAKFSKACKSRVKKYSQAITEQSKRLGQFMDWDNSYHTMADTNIEHIWNFLKKCQDKKMLYQGYTSLPWCTRCGTSLSSHELHDNYQVLTHKAVYIKYQLKDRKEKLLVWTTTPWTLLANVAVAVDPKMDYVIVKSGQEQLIIAKNRLDSLPDKLEIIKELKGDELVGEQYLGVFDELEAVKTDHKIIAWDNVGDDEGTGLVHIAPGCGQEDFELAKEHNLVILAPIDQAGNYIKGYGKYTGKCITGINQELFDDLEKKSALYLTEDYKHRYPSCWRCNEPLAFRAVKEWFIKADPVRAKMKKESAKVNWVPDDAGKRMQNWLDNMADWNISRKRYWGIPLPFYPCSCGELTVVGSKEELKKRAVNPKLVDKIPELHRPWIDRIEINCPKCGKPIKRVTEVGDCWLDAGIVPYSTLDYLHDKKNWEKWFPAEFIVEMKEQVRLWFYSMLFMSTVLEGKVPYKQVLTHSSVADENGDEMHKSKGNAIWFDEAVEKMGADVMRWMFLSQNPVYTLRFGYARAKELRSKFNTWWNSLSFLSMYADIDHWQPKKSEKLKSKVQLDQWLIARLKQLNLVVEESMTELRPEKAVKEFDRFLNNLSNWYIRRSRRRFWKSKNDQDKESAFNTLYWVLKDSAILMAPFFPFFTEQVFQALKDKGLDDKLSVHLNDYPKSEKLTKVEEKLIKDMADARGVVEQGLSQRAKARIKVRQPLPSLEVDCEFTKEISEIIKDEVNVKKMVLGKNIKLDTNITSELKQEGLSREIVRQIQSLRKKADYNLDDRITVYYQTSDADLETVVGKFEKYISKEVLSEKGLINEKGKVDQEADFEIEDQQIWLGVKR